MSTIQRVRKCSRKFKQSPGVSCEEVVKFLKANYSWIDGDVESQVLTALFSCIKTGLVCILNNSKYLLLGANSKNMISNCVTRISHGPKCCCLSTLECLFNIPRTCCVVKNSEYVINKSKKATKSKPKGKSKSSPRARKPRKIIARKQTKKNCVTNAQEMIGTSKSTISFGKMLSDPKCNFCLGMHSNPNLRKLCKACYPIGKSYGVPSDKFSPRDELTPKDVEKTCENPK